MCPTLKFQFRSSRKNKMLTRRLLTFTFALALCALHCQARRRNLTEVTYRFTNCGSENHDGPRVNNMCRPFYESINSPITRKRLFQFEQFNGEFDGAQGFRLPEDGLYNITIAGARGGEGICNFVYGKGGAVAFQVELSTDYEYLIMVGHRGTSVCEVPENANYPVCQQPRPRTLAEVDNCNETWFNWTRAFSQGNVNNSYNFNGGGGGGGASMIWPRRRNNQELTDLPIAIAPGGGGASAILNYQSLSTILANTSGLQYPQSADSEWIYNYHVNGRFNQYNLDWPEGARGFRQSNPRFVTSGAGGGWNPLPSLPLLEIDGKLLSQQVNFAQGGTDCSSTLATSDADVFTGVFGGYGGGGGGCGSGGGGGGYTGGHVFTNINTFPGSGGDGAIFILSTFSLISILGQSENSGDGYVEIVSSNCECAGQCVVYSEEGQFECLCPNDTILAQDGRSCYQERTIPIVQQEPLQFTSQGETVFITGLQFTNFSYSIYGLNVSLTVNPNPDNQLPLEDIGCAVMFVDRNLQSVWASNPIRIGTGRAYKLSMLSNSSTNGLQLDEDYAPFLEYPAFTAGAVLVSNGQCSLSSDFNVNISSVIDTEPHQNFTMLFTAIGDDVIVNATRLILQEPIPVTEATTGSTHQPLAPVPVNTGLIIGLVIVGGILLVTIIGIVMVLVYIKHSLKKKRTLTLHSARESGANLIQPQNNETPFIDYATVKPNEATPVTKESEKGNEYTYVSVKGGTIINPYAMLIPDDKAYENTGHSETAFKPRYGIIAPTVDFTMYNRERSNTEIHDWSYPRNNLVYLRELGEGQFGKVLLMKAKDIAGYKGKIPVAVKTLTSGDLEAIKKFMEEAELMKKFSHPNIVSLLGISIADSDGEVDEDSAPLMILEYMPYGDLQSFLTSHQPDENGHTSINQQHFLKFSIDIAKALGFLAINKYVHRDVAARNCLVGPDLHIKIADFGLSRGVHDKDYYKVAGRAVLPVRWMAPESLVFGIFSSASDVWSYGVLIWEITSYGDTPLETLEVQEIVAAARNECLKHSRPELCTDELYEVMCKCHCHEADERPSFENILTTLVKEN